MFCLLNLRIFDKVLEEKPKISLVNYSLSTQPRLQGALSLKQKGPLRGLTGIEDRKRDVNRAGDPKSEGEKYFLSAIVKFSKKREKISPGAEVATLLGLI